MAGGEGVLLMFGGKFGPTVGEVHVMLLPLRADLVQRRPHARVVTGAGCKSSGR